MKTILLALTLLSINLTLAQGFEWAKSFGGTGDDRVNSITLDSDGNVYSTGNFSGTVDFDPGIGLFNMTASSGSDIFVSKLDAFGNLVWAKQFTGSVSAQGTSIVTSHENIYITGGFQGTVDFNPSTIITDTFFMTSVDLSLDIFICKLDTAGDFIWAKQIGDQNTEESNTISVSGEGYINISGKFNNSVDFNPDPFNSNLLISAGNEDLFICQLDSLGNYNWAISIGSNDYDHAVSHQVDEQGNIYATGFFTGGVDFDPSINDFIITSDLSSADIFVLKLNKNGQFIWANHFTGPLWEYPSCIEVDNKGNAYLGGRIQGTTDFNSEIGIADTFYLYNACGYICKLDSSGNFLWAKQFTGYCNVFSLAADESGNIYSTGDFNQTVDFDPNLGTYNLIGWDSDVFITKLDSLGQFISAFQLAGNLTYEAGNSIAVVNSNIYTAGVFTGVVDFDPDSINSFNLSSNGGNDFFIHKIYQCNIDPSVTQSATALTSNASGVNYQWVNCSNNYTSIVGAVNQIFTPLVSGNYAVILSYNSCIDTSACYNLIISSIYEASLNNDFLLYPNPSDGNVTLDLGSTNQNVIILITDLSGKVIKEIQNYTGQFVQLNISDNISGVYLLSIISADKNETFKLIKY